MERRKTPLWDLHRQLGARLIDFGGWDMPVQYAAGTIKEHKAVRDSVGLFDVSHMGECYLRGPKVSELVDRLATNKVAAAPPGKAVYTLLCHQSGGVIDDCIFYKKSEQEYFVIVNASNTRKDISWFREQAKHPDDVEDVSDRTALIAVQGPRALELLKLAGASIDPTQLRSFRFADGSVADVKVTIARTGYTGEDGVELFCPNAGAARLFGALLDAGQTLGVEPIGLGARDTLRLDARLSLYGNEIDETTNPIEAGLSWVVKLDKPGGFLGKDAIAKVKADGPTRTIVGFEMVGRGIGRHGYPLLSSAGELAGVCTSGGPSPTLGKSIGLGYVPVALAAVGTPLLVDCRGKSIEAKVVKTPFYKRKPSSGTA